MNEEGAGLTEIKGKPKVKERKVHKELSDVLRLERRNPTTLLVRSEGQTYADMLKKIKSHDSVKQIGQNFHSIKKTNSGLLRVELVKGAHNSDDIMDAPTSAIGMDTKILKFSDLIKIEIRDIDEEATEEEILKAANEVYGKS